ncbi:uncharacterized protein PAC_05790 [Phialocephala subalpina]|uniref:Uncharacterized protein n=1 Tax=Phialocephala subalpina TaxID=576137 RepID=A0A1L7WSZ1_9HELO|nr:uncharacterized protein PAC_05790 [Phialocephala subalpina]
MVIRSILLALLATPANAKTTVEWNCTKGDSGLQWLENALSCDSLISCKGSPGQEYNTGQYSTGQGHAQNATWQGLCLGFRSPFDDERSSPNTMIIDLSYMNKTTVIPNFTTSNGSMIPVIAYQGGSDWAQVLKATGGSGYTAVGARDSRVGVVGFSTDGGIGFLAGAYYIDDKDTPQAQNNTVSFFNTNNDHFALMDYYALGYVPPNLSTTNPSTFSTRALLVALRFNDPTNPSQPSYNATFSKLLAIFTPTHGNVFNVPYVNATQLVDAFFPYGFRRGFYGSQTTKISASYLNSITVTIDSYI